MNARFGLLMLSAALLTHCSGERSIGDFFRGNKAAPEVFSDGAKVASQVNASETTTLKIESGALAGTLISLPAGSTTAGVSVMVGESAAPSEFTALMSGGQRVIAASVPLEISASNSSGEKLSSVTIPMTITIPISETTLALLNASQNRDQLCVLLKSNNNALFLWRRSEISISGNSAVVSSQHFGTYQLAYCGDEEMPGFSESKAFKLASADCLDPDLGSVLAGVSLMLCDGTLGVGTYQASRPCEDDGEVGCVTTASQPAAAIAELKASDVRSGKTVAGVQGSLSNCSSDGQVDCIANDNFKAADVSGFSASDLLAEHTVAGIAGTLAVDPWDLRVGKSVGDTTGLLKTNCRNRVTTAEYNRDDISNESGTGGTILDWWDTIDDSNGLSSSRLLLPSESPTGWDDSTLCGIDNWKDVTVGGCDAAGKDCMMKDLISGLTWTEDMGGLHDWATAVAGCNNLTFGGHSDWRLPTQKESIAAHVNGIRDTFGRGDGLPGFEHFIKELSGKSQKFWTATSSGQTNSAWYIAFSSGVANGFDRGDDTAYYSCVR